jgi:MerR family transcriptional regulator, copper efflux regulator
MAAGLRSGALARASGVSSDTLRYYERRGLLPRPPRDPSGYRRYPPEAVQRVIVIQRALDAGFSLAELSRILKQRDAGGAPCREVFAIAVARLQDLDDRIATLIDLRDRLGKLMPDWRRTLDATPAGARARLLEALGTAPPARSPRAKYPR